ncbi:hypothetical protein [Paenibacillus taichungensis]
MSEDDKEYIPSYLSRYFKQREIFQRQMELISGQSISRMLDSTRVSAKIVMYSVPDYRNHYNDIGGVNFANYISNYSVIKEQYGIHKGLALKVVDDVSAVHRLNFDIPILRAAGSVMNDSLSTGRLSIRSISDIIVSLPPDIVNRLKEASDDIEEDTNSSSFFKSTMTLILRLLSNSTGIEKDTLKDGAVLRLLTIFFLLNTLWENTTAPLIENIIFPDSSDEILEVNKQQLEEQKRHNAVTESNQEKEIQIKEEILEELKKLNTNSNKD